MAGKAFKSELLDKTGHDLAWFSNAIAGCRGGVDDIYAHLRDFENMKHAANAARETAKTLLQIAELLDPTSSKNQAYTAFFKVSRTAMSFGCASLGYVDRDDCRDENEEWRRLAELAATKGYEIISHDGDKALVRLPR